MAILDVGGLSSSSSGSGSSSTGVVLHPGNVFRCPSTHPTVFVGGSSRGDLMSIVQTLKSGLGLFQTRSDAQCHGQRVMMMTLPIEKERATDIGRRDACDEISGAGFDLKAVDPSATPDRSTRLVPLTSHSRGPRI